MNSARYIVSTQPVLASATVTSSDILDLKRLLNLLPQGERSTDRTWLLEDWMMYVTSNNTWHVVTSTGRLTMLAVVVRVYVKHLHMVEDQ